jgi:alpha-L-fucosidase
VQAPDKNFETNIYTLELIPVSKKTAIVKELAKIEKATPKMDWFSYLKYGVMFHWTSMTMPLQGEQKSYKDAVRDFDVGAFVSMVERMGADYVIFTGNHAENYFPGPLKKWEKEYPGMTTERDLIAEISDALKKKNIRFILYLASHIYAKIKDEKTDLKEFERLNFELITEIGKHYKDKIDGYWFDGWYQSNEKFPGFDYEKFYNICKIGNPNRLLGLNTWLYTITTPWQDYWAGEVYTEGTPPVNRINQSGPAKGLQFHNLIVMEDDWLHTKKNTKIISPTVKVDNLINYISSSIGKGPITLNIIIYEDGTVSEESLAVMEKLKQKFKK